MDITFTIPLTEIEELELATILGIGPDNLRTVVSSFGVAAAEEYLSMIRGQKVLKRGSDILEYRLFLLIKYAFNGIIPSEQKVCSLFQTTLTESRSLIRSVISKYQYQIKEFLTDTLRQVLTNATHVNEEDDYTVVINGINFVDELNRLLAEVDGTLTPVTKKKGSVSTYEIKPASYNALQTRLAP